MVKNTKIIANNADPIKTEIFCFELFFSFHAAMTPRMGINGEPQINAGEVITRMLHEGLIPHSASIDSSERRSLR